MNYVLSSSDPGNNVIIPELQSSWEVARKENFSCYPTRSTAKSLLVYHTASFDFGVVSFSSYSSPKKADNV